jgi:NDP-sugar pyrophosphorylase family protein
VNLHYLPHTITRVLGDGSDLSARVRYSWEQPRILGSAGGPRHALDLLAEDPFVIVNGDTLTDLNLAALIDAHAAHSTHGTDRTRGADGGVNALVTLALVPNREPHKYGGVVLDGGGAVTGFVPPGPAAEGSHHFIGVQVAQAEAFRDVPQGEPARSIGGVYDALIAARAGTVRGFVCDAAFWDIGTVADYERTSAELERQR